MAKKGNHTKISDEEMEKMRDIFDLFDEDSSGSISLKEFKTVVRATGANPSEEELKKMMESADSDKNGVLEFDEFVNYVMELKSRVYLDLKTAFKCFDKNGDGFLTRDELKHVLVSLGEKMGDKEVDDFLKSYDKDGDGRIDLEEFVNALEDGV